MKTSLRFIAPLMLGAFCLLLSACSTENSVVEPSTNQPSPRTGGDLRSQLISKVGVEKAEAILTPYTVSKSKGGNSVQATITYEAEICNGTFAGTSTRNAINDATAWKYYKFFGTQGDKVTIAVNRTGCGIDPAFNLYAGVTSVSEGLAVGSGNSEMEWLTWVDDSYAPLIGCGCQGDPELQEYEITESGWYTITVFDFNGCGDDLGYELEVSGLTCTPDPGGVTDTDGDGVSDDTDPFPESDSQANIVIDIYDTGVENQYLGDGVYMMDKIIEIREKTNRHFKFVLCTSLQAAKWKRKNLITRKERNKIIYYATKSSW